MKIEIDFKATLWTNVKARCPICNKNFTSWYCPTCGLPKKNSKFSIYDGFDRGPHNCGAYHFRPEFSQVGDFQLCSKCCTTNPFSAKYCRNCGDDITSQGMDKNGHGWVDLGLSVLWSTENMNGYYYWMDTENREIYGFPDNPYRYKISSEDVASYIWGNKWRTPTKAEFNELIEKCDWMPIIIPETQKTALKVTGSNGNHIIIPTTGHLVESTSGFLTSMFNSQNSRTSKNFISCETTHCFLWTSTEKDNVKGRRAYAFRYHINPNTTKDTNSLWLSTQIDKKTIFTHYLLDGSAKEVSYSIFSAFAVRPVADKKWQGKL